MNKNLFFSHQVGLQLLKLLVIGSARDSMYTYMLFTTFMHLYYYSAFEKRRFIHQGCVLAEVALDLTHQLWHKLIMSYCKCWSHIP